MKTDLLGQEKNFVRIKLDYEAAEFDKAIQKTLRKLAQDINIKGFRKGHAPRRIIEMQVGRDYLYHEAVEALVNDSIPEIVNEYELELLASPTFNPGEIKEGEPLSGELTFEVMPEVKLPELSEISVERVRTKVTDEAVEQFIMHVRCSFADTFKVGTGEGEQDRGIVSDDIVNVDFKSHVEGEETEYPSQVRSIDLVDSTIRPEVRDALIGKKVGDTVTVDFKTEENYPQENLAGKSIHYEMRIIEITGRVLPELNEELFKKYLGEKTEILTEDAFRSWARETLTKNMDDQYDIEAAGRAFAEIIKRTELEVPETLINREVADIRKRDEEEARERYGMDLKTFMGGENDPDWEKNYLEVQKIRAQSIVQQALVSDEIAKVNELKIEQNDLVHWAEEQAMLYQVTPNRIMASLAQNREVLNLAVDQSRREKVLKFILTKVNVQEVDELTPVAPAPEAPSDVAQEGNN